MKKLRVLLIGLFLTFIFLEIWLGFPLQLEKGSQEKLAPSIIGENSSGPEKKMVAVHLAESRAGQKDWELFAESAEGYEGEGSWELRNVKVQFYANEKIEFIVSGDEGMIDSKSKNMKIQGKVVVKSNNGYVMNTQIVHYNAKERKLKSQDRVKMTAPVDQYGKGMTIEGDWMEILVDENLMKISNRVSAKKNLNEGKKFVISSGSAEFSGRHQQAKFLDQVSIELDNMKMEGPEAEFVYRGSSELLQSVLMKGGVRVSDFEKYATSDSVKFDPVDNRITLSGNPRVVQDQDEISGDQIILMDGGRKVKVEKMRARVEKIKE